MPDLPIPQTITRPLQVRIFFTTSEKAESIRRDIATIASASASQTCLAWDISLSIERLCKGSTVALPLLWDNSSTRDIDLLIIKGSLYFPNVSQKYVALWQAGRLFTL
jgi:hypothetical protein